MSLFFKNMIPIFLKRYARVLRKNICLAGLGLNSVSDSPHAVSVYPNLGIVFNHIRKSGNTSVALWLCEAEALRSGNSITRRKSLMDLSAVRLIRARDYQWIVVVRNPYDRVLSAFLDKVASGDRHEKEKKSGFDNIPGWGDPTPMGFRRFIDYLQHGGLYVNQHWWPQKGLLVRPLECYQEE